MADSPKLAALSEAQLQNGLAALHYFRQPAPSDERVVRAIFEAVLYTEGALFTFVEHLPEQQPA